jgi:VIT1/CCC1 family predicted Fe2+/Mn2+ transporter
VPSTDADHGLAPRPEHHHRDVGTGAARAAVFGISDGLVSNSALVLGMAAADASAAVVRLAGLFGLLAGAVSMAAGEYNSMQAQRELLQRELAIELRELHRNPNVEAVELTQIYQSRGVPADQAQAMALALAADPERALQVHAREELGIDPDDLGDPLAAASWSFGGFSLGAIVPVVPWFVTAGNTGLVSSLVLALVTAVVVGVVTARFAARSATKIVARQVGFFLAGVAITTLLGRIAGIDASG